MLTFVHQIFLHPCISKIGSCECSNEATDRRQFKNTKQNKNECVATIATTNKLLNPVFLISFPLFACVLLNKKNDRKQEK